jgi:hypothetical protein
MRLCSSVGSDASLLPSSVRGMVRGGQTLGQMACNALTRAPSHRRTIFLRKDYEERGFKPTTPFCESMSRITDV